MAGPTLMTLPLEMRHNIFKAAAERPDGTRKVLRRWFEKKDVKAQIVELQAEDPNTTYVAVYGDDDPYFGSLEYANSDSDSEDDEDAEGADVEDEDEEDEAEADYPGDDNDEDEDEDEDEEDIDEDASDDDEEAMEDAPDHRLPTEPVAPHTKWRHIPKFLTISGTPPPLELMLASKQLSHEATEWFYEVAIMTIDVTGSIAHTSMFEEALHQIVDAAFSPFEKIRNITLKFVWDTEWLRSAEAQGKEEIFQTMLIIRVSGIVDILSRCPKLKKLTLEWHDSLKDPQSESHKYQTYDNFERLPVELIVKEHFLTPGTKPSRKTDIGKKRRELMAIAATGFDHFY